MADYGLIAQARLLKAVQCLKSMPPSPPSCASILLVADCGNRTASFCVQPYRHAGSPAHQRYRLGVCRETAQRTDNLMVARNFPLPARILREACKARLALPGVARRAPEGQAQERSIGLRSPPGPAN